MTKKDYVAVAKCIVNARKRALNYYGGDIDDANDKMSEDSNTPQQPSGGFKFGFKG